MRTFNISLVIFACISLIKVSSFGQISDFIHVDQFGYLTNADKFAVISNPQVGYNSSDNYVVGSILEIRDFQNNATVYSGAPTIWKDGITHSTSGDQGWWFDFSSVVTPGSYYVYDTSTGERSAPFNINSNPYDEVLKAAFKMFYYNRCNFEKAGPYAAAGWTDGNNFDNNLQDFNCRDAYDQGNSNTEKDLSGGWFDAGDYNKYVTFAHNPVHDLLSSYEENPTLFTDDWNIPESGNGLSDILDEIKWELDFLLKMTNADGSVHIKMGSIAYDDNAAAPPSANTDARYYAPTCSSAAIANASMFAHSALVFENEPGMASYAATLEATAISCWNSFIVDFNANTLETNCDDGLVKAGDADRDEDEQKQIALVAAVYLYDLTGNFTYLDFIEDYYDEVEPLSNSFWGPYQTNLIEALLHYTTLSGINNTVRTAILNSASTDINNNWNSFFAFSDDDLYRAQSPDWTYHWGSNLPKANLGVLCKIFEKYNVVPSANNDLEEKAAEQLHYFHGINPQGLVYLSNMYGMGGDRCVDEIYHTWFNDGTVWDNAINSTNGPAPGYLVGGPNKDFSVGSLTPPSNQPPLKSYLDFNDGFPNNSWEISEPAIYYQTAFIRLLASYTNTSLISSNVNVSAVNNCLEVFPNPTSDYFVVRGTLSNYNIKVLDSSMSVFQSVTTYGSDAVIDISTLPSGLFFVLIENLNSGDMCVRKIIKEN